MSNEKDKKTLLLVEDDVIIGMAESQSLRFAGYNVISATSGEKAIETVKKQKGIDLILMDIDLGSGIDGTQTSKVILEIQEVPIVFLTSHSEKEMVERVKGITRYGYVIKNSGDFVLQSSIEMAFELFEANQRTKKKEEKLRVTLNSIGDAVIATDNHGAITKMNPIAEKLTGWSYHDALGHTISDVFKIVNAKSRKPVENPVDKVLQTGKIVGLANHTALLSKDGKEYQISDSGAPILNENGETLGVVLVFRDVTEEYKIQENLKASEIRFSTIFKTSPLGMSLSRYKDGVYVDVNDEFLKMFRLSRSEVIGRTSAELEFWVNPNSLDWMMSILKETGKVEGIELEFLRKTGETGVLQIFVEQIEINGEHYLLSINNDITQIKQTEKELQKSIAEKEILLKELQHRVKNSLNVVSSLLSFEFHNLKDEDSKRIFLNAQSRIHSMSKIYEGLYRSSDIDKLDLHTYIQDLIHSFSEMYVIDPEKVLFSVKLDPVKIDLKRALPMGLILNELITNSLKYAYPSGQKGEIRIHLNKINNHVNLVVSDDGEGLPGMINPKTGNHLGFMLVRNLTEQLEGVISTISQPGEGLTVILSLKL
ncbi:PAS domain S-box protein [Leptospira idonii]|uniref:histidine kinase n=1 Tax=Leptospira idonii TaxID=1193500 RepID=A0A4R9LUB5_9LEPT|nr:PAS domain S-box protein [Leptospira idonii]TGN17395.1 response regulator [Leptospira idonii]